MHRQLFRKGFTLVELLIVVMIVGILALAAMATLGSDNIPAAMRTEALNTMGVLKNQLEMWHMQNPGGAMPIDLAAWETMGSGQ